MSLQVFPSDNPSSRTDAVMLDNWISRSLEEVEDNLAATRQQHSASMVPK